MGFPPHALGRSSAKSALRAKTTLLPGLCSMRLALLQQAIQCNTMFA